MYGLIVSQMLIVASLCLISKLNVDINNSLHLREVIWKWLSSFHIINLKEKLMFHNTQKKFVSYKIFIP